MALLSLQLCCLPQSRSRRLLLQLFNRCQSNNERDSDLPLTVGIDGSVVCRSLNRHLTDVVAAAAVVYARRVTTCICMTFAKAFTGITQKTDVLSPIHTANADLMRRSSREPVKTVRVKTVLGKNGPGKKGPSDYLDSI